MDCDAAVALIDGYLDGELDLVKALEVERHVRGCADCSRRYAERRALRGAIRDASAALYYPAPARLERRIRAALPGEDPPRHHRAMIYGPWRWGGVAAAAAAVAVLGAVLLPARLATRAPDDVLVQAAVAGHDRSLVTGHLTDVVSTDRHTVKPWFNGRLDFLPPVVDLKEQGFPLVGGRVDELADRPVAALVYRRGRHVINLFVWPDAPGAAAPPAAGTAARRGYNVAHWDGAGMTFWAVSDLNGAELSDFARMVRGAVSPPGG